jgi:hypothetical protein
VSGRAHLILLVPDMRRRPAPRSTGAVVCALLLLAACSGPPSLDAPAVSGADARACKHLMDVLPAEVADKSRVDVEAGEGYGAAWGDPAIELRCGVGTPRGFDEVAGCQNANGVDWFVPESQQSGRPEDIVMTTVGRSVNVEVRIPSDYWPPVNTMVDLAPAVKKATRSVKPCV